jgi:uncharacterized protein (TIGR03382 family)
MALRALRALALGLLPSLALAQTSAVILNTKQVNQADCAGTGSVIVTWTTTFTSGSGDTVRVSAASSCPTTAPTENGSGTLGADVTLFQNTQSQSFSIASIQSAVTASCTNVNDTAVNVCVYHIAGGGTGISTFVGNATFTFQTAVPPAPANVSAGAANAAIEVSYGAGTKGGNYNADTVTYAVEWAPQGSTTFTRTGETTATTLRVGGLTNGVTYDARVVPFSSAGNEGPVSATVSATPDDFLDYWSRYKADGGREEGGCGSGGTGALAPLLLALAVLLRRRA